MRDIATNPGTTPSRHRARIVLLVSMAALALIARCYLCNSPRGARAAQLQGTGG